MAQIRNFTSTNDSYFVLDGVSYPKVYEAMLDNGYTKDRVKLVGTNRDNSPLVFSTHYSNIKVDGVSFANAQEAISRLNQVVFSKGGGSGGGGTTGNYIPLSGTEEGKPVIGNIELNEYTKLLWKNDIYEFYVQNLDEYLQLRAYRQGENSSLVLQLDASTYELVLITDEYSKGFVGAREYNKQQDRKAFAQLSDVYDSQSYSTEETKTGGTWIDGKPIYTITKLTADPIPADIETQFPNIIVGSYTIYKYTKTID